MGDYGLYRCTLWYNREKDTSLIKFVAFIFCSSIWKEKYPNPGNECGETRPVVQFPGLFNMTCEAFFMECSTRAWIQNRHLSLIKLRSGFQWGFLVLWCWPKCYNELVMLPDVVPIVAWRCQQHIFNQVFWKQKSRRCLPHCQQLFDDSLVFSVVWS